MSIYNTYTHTHWLLKYSCLEAETVWQLTAEFSCTWGIVQAVEGGRLPGCRMLTQSGQLLGKAFAQAEAQPKGLDKATTAHTSLFKANRKENANGTVPVALHCGVVQK